MGDDYEKQQSRARRHESKRQRLGSPAPVCLSCGCRDIETLLAAPVANLASWFLERNHLAKHASDLRVPLCRNCHAILTDRQEDWDRRLRYPKTPLERLAALLQGLVDWLVQLAGKMTELAARLQEWVRWLLRGMVGEAPA